MNLTDAANTIAAVGTTRTVLLTGEPGVGKTSVLKTLAAKMPSHQAVYIDCPVLDLPEIGLPEVADGQVHIRPGAVWGLDDPRPKLILLDELTKAPQTTRLFLTRLLLERTLGAQTFPKGTIIFGTGNRAADGVGDTLAAHVANRLIILEVDKPTSTQWLEWAEPAGIHPAVLAFADRFPHAFDPAGTEGNPYVQDPKRQSLPFVSPRSLHAASDVLHALDGEPAAVILAALSGTIGVAAARDLQTLALLHGQLPGLQEVLAAPRTATLSDVPAARIISAFAFAAKANKTNIGGLMTYFARLPAEYASIFARHAAKRLGADLPLCAEFMAWLRANAWIF